MTFDRPHWTQLPWTRQPSLTKPVTEPNFMHLVFKFGDKDKHNIKIHCDVNDKIGDVITKFHEKHGRKYTKVIIDGDVISTADYKMTLSQLEIEDEDCIQVRD